MFLKIYFMCMSVLASLYVCMCTTCSFDLASRFPTACMGQIPACWCKDGSSFKETGPNKFPGLFPGFPFGIGTWKVLRVTALETNSNKAFVQALFLCLLEVRTGYSLKSNGSLNMSFAGKCTAAPSSSSGSSVREAGTVPV